MERRRRALHRGPLPLPSSSPRTSWQTRLPAHDFMTIKLGVVMDPIGSINPKKDSTFAMLLAGAGGGGGEKKKKKKKKKFFFFLFLFFCFCVFLFLSFFFFFF